MGVGCHRVGEVWSGWCTLYCAHDGSRCGFCTMMLSSVMSTPAISAKLLSSTHVQHRWLKEGIAYPRPFDTLHELKLHKPYPRTV